MRIIPQFDPSATTSGTIDVQVVNRCGTIVLYNESNIGLVLTFGDGSTGMLPAWWAKSFKTPVPNTSQVTWAQNYILSSAQPPISLVIGEAFEPSENGPIINVGLSRQTNIGNVVSTAMGGSTVLQNDGNAPGTQIIESTVAGDSASAVTLTNTGLLTLGDATYPGGITSNGHITIANNVAFQSKTTGGAARDLLYIDAANTTDLQAATLGGIIQFKDSNGTTHAAINMTNNSLQMTDSSHVLHDVLYVDNANELVIQMANSSAKIYFKDPSGVALASLDSSGNLKIKGTLTQNTTP